jgi:DNA-directed RNA polymerase subunit E'/Rpb7
MSEVPYSPYINTTLITPVMIQPNQMDNKLYTNIKYNLIRKLEGKCYLTYGYINKINKIEDISEGVVEAEDATCSIKFVVKFNCKLCYPIKNKYLICKIDRMNKTLISAINGPIKVIITPDKINKDIFYPDGDRNIRIKEKSKLIEPELYVKVLILQSTFSNYDTSIIAIGNLHDIATDDEIAMYNKDNIINTTKDNEIALSDSY